MSSYLGTFFSLLYAFVLNMVEQLICADQQGAFQFCLDSPSVFLTLCLSNLSFCNLQIEMPDRYSIVAGAMLMLFGVASCAL